jgi:hypothetical protein
MHYLRIGNLEPLEHTKQDPIDHVCQCECTDSVPGSVGLRFTPAMQLLPLIDSQPQQVRATVVANDIEK